MKRSDLTAILFFLVLVLVFFLPVLTGSSTLVPFDNLYRFPPWSAFAASQGVTTPHNPLLDDLILENYAWKTFLNQSIHAGELPLWNPYLFAGQPFLAAGQNAALYPPGIVFYLLPLTLAYGVFAALHYWIAACAMYWLARVLGLRAFAATVSGVVFAFGGFMVVSVVFPMVVSAAAWLPAILALVELALRRAAGSPRVEADAENKTPAPEATRIQWWHILLYGLLAGILLGAQFLAGHIEVSYYILLVLAYYATWRLVAANVRLRPLSLKAGGLTRGAAVVAAIVALGLALAAIQLLPLYELVAQNFREGSVAYAQVAEWALPVRQVLTFFIPDAFGNPTAHSYFDLFERTVKPAPQGTIFWGVKNYVEAGAYIGLLAMALAVCGVLAAVTRRTPDAPRERERVRVASSTWLFTVLAIVSLLFAFGTPLYAILFYGLPGWNQLHTAFRWIFPWTVAMAFLAGAGAQALAEGWVRRGVSLLAGVLGAVGLGTLAALGASLVVPGPFLALADRFVNSSDLAKPVFETGQAFWSYEARNLLLFAVFALGAAVALYAARAGWNARGLALWKPLALGTLVLDLFVAGMGFYPRAGAQLETFVPPAIRFLQQDTSLFRVATYNTPGEKTLNANAAMLYGLSDIRGYDSIIAKQYVEYMRALAPQDELLYNRIAPFYDYSPLSSPLLNLLNVKYVLTTRTVPYPAWPLVYDGELKIYQNPNVLPRAFLVGNARVFAGRDALLAALPTLKPAQEVWLETTSPPLGERTEAASGRVAVTKYTGGEVTLDVRTSAPTYLVLADTYFPGWIGQIDGQDTPVYRADGNFRAVVVPQGEHTVRFKYSPVSFRVGSVLSLLAVITVLLALVALVWQRFVLRELEESQVRTVAKNSLVPMAASLLIQVINFALALVVLRVLGPENNGRYAFAVTAWFFLSAVTEFGLGILVTREVARDRTRANVFLTNSVVLRLGLTFLSVILLAGVIAFYTATGDIDNQTMWALILLWVSLFPNNLAGAFSVMFNAFERFEYPTAVEIATALVSVALQIAALLAGYGIVGLAAVSIGTNLFTLAVIFVLVRRLLFKPQFAFDRSLLRWMVFESYPLMLNNLLANLFFKVDVFLLLPLTNATVLGYYNAAYKFVNALNFIPSKFTLAIFPMLSRYAAGSGEAIRRALIVSVKLLVWIALPITVATVFIAPQLILLFAGAAYLPDSAIALQWLIWFLPFSFMNSVVHYVLIALNEQRFLTRAFLVGLGFNLAANWLAIPPLTYRGAALVTVLSELALLVPFYYALRKHMSALPILDMFWRPGAAAAAMAAALFVLMPQNLFVALIVGTLVYGLGLFVLGALGPDEWMLLQRLVPRRFARALVFLSRGALDPAP